MTDEPSIKEKFKMLHQDAVLWKAERLWLGANDPDEQSAAMEQITEMLCCISNETKRTGYVDLVQKHIKSKSGLLKKLVTDELKRRREEAEEKKVKAAFEAKINTVEDAGLPEDFKGSKDDIYAALKYGIYVYDNVYYTRGGNRGDYPISNFTMKIIYHVASNDDLAFRLISIKSVYGFEFMININTDDFVSLGSFKKILARNGDLVFKGSDADLCRLQEFLQKDETSAKRIDTLGWNNRHRFWAWSNGLTIMNEDDSTAFVPVDKYGIVEHNERKYFIPACSMMYAEKDGMFVNEKKFIYTNPVEGFGFGEWSKLMFGAYKEKSIPAILFYIGTLFRDIMMSKVRRYPLINLFGPPGAGKGEMYDSLMHMFGHKQDQIMLGGATTVVGFMRKLAQFKNAIVGLDEYKNNLLPKVIESLKNLYDGIGYERGKMTNDFATESTPVNSSTILSGQDMPTIEPALFMRCVMLSFEEGKFSAEQRNCFQKLKNDHEHHGLSYITADILKFRKVFEEKFKEHYQVVFKQTITDVANVEIDDRMIMNISIFLTIMHLTRDDLQYPFTYSQAKTFLIENMQRQFAILAGNDDLARFWGVIESLYHQDEIKDGRDFIIEDGYLYIRMMQAHPMYQKEMIQRRDSNYLTKPTLEYYLELDKATFAGKVKKRFPDGSNNWTYKMKYAKLDVDMFKTSKRENFQTDEDYKKAISYQYKKAGIDNPDEDDDEPVSEPINGQVHVAEQFDDELPFPPYNKN